jgi:pimeloyl-ACP methyl ester carboxylesterase
MKGLRMSSIPLSGPTARPRRTVGRRIARALLALLALLAALAGAGAAYQAYATARDRAAFPPPGQMVDVGGYRIHLLSQGENNGNATVVLIGCGGCTSANWGWVLPEVAKETRVVNYERAGFGWSEPGPAPRDAAQNARELHAALAGAHILGPYVLVGHSYGGTVARVFAAAHPGEVAGLVLIDPRHPDQDAHMPAEMRDANASEGRLIALLGWMARLGALRLTGIGHEQARDLPPEWAGAYAASYNTSQYWESIQAQGAAIAATDAEVRAAGELGDLPLIVLSADEAWLTPGAPADEVRRVYTQLNIEQVALSSNSAHRLVPSTSHTSLVNSREDARAAIDAIREVVEAAGTGGRLAP